MGIRRNRKHKEKLRRLLKKSEATLASTQESKASTHRTQEQERQGRASLADRSHPATVETLHRFLTGNTCKLPDDTRLLYRTVLAGERGERRQTEESIERERREKQGAPRKDTKAFCMHAAIFFMTATSHSSSRGIPGSPHRHGYYYPRLGSLRVAFIRSSQNPCTIYL